MSRIDVRKTYKLYIGGEFPRSESGHSYVVNDSKGKLRGQRRPGLPQGRPRRRRRRPQGVPGWAGKTAYNRAQILYRVAEIMEDRRPQFVAAVRESEGLNAARPTRWSTSRSTAWSGTPGGPTSSPRSSATPTPSPARSSTSRLPSRPAWSPCSRRRSRRCSGWSASSPPVGGHRQHGGRRVVVRAPAAGGDVLRGAGDLRRPGRSGQHPHRVRRDHRALAGRAHGRQRDRPGRHRRRQEPTLATELEVAAAENLKRVRRAPAAEPDWTVDPGLEPMTDFLEIKTVWHPIGV